MVLDRLPFDEEDHVLADVRGEAVSFERTARHLDAAGRANESIALSKKDMAMQDAAIRAYQDAIKLDPKMFSSQLGLGRLYVTRKEMALVKKLNTITAGMATKRPNAVVWLMWFNSLKPPMPRITPRTSALSLMPAMM